MATASKTQYDSVAEAYAAWGHLPIAKLEHELIAKAIGDCTGLTVLDLGGGNGQYARKAVEQGAKSVDVIDISPAMLQLGKQTEASSGGESKICWFEGDVSKSLHDLPLLPKGYDVVMCNWVFDHATNEQELESMWHNAAEYTKQGGTLVNVRAVGPFDLDYFSSGKYGLTMNDLRKIPGGVRYKVQFLIDPPFEFEGTTMDVNASLTNELNHRNGYGDLKLLRAEETEVVKNDLAFWDEFLKYQYMAVLHMEKL